MEETQSVLSDQQKLFQEELHSIISPEIFEKQKPSSFNRRAKNASISFRIALTNLSKQNGALIPFQSKPQILLKPLLKPKAVNLGSTVLLFKHYRVNSIEKSFWKFMILQRFG